MFAGMGIWKPGLVWHRGTLQHLPLHLYVFMFTPVFTKAIASYITQSILVFLFCTALYIYYLCRVPKSDFRNRNIKKALNMFLDTSAQFTIPVSVAAIVRIKQSAPFYEITFLQSLMTMQFLGLLAASLTLAAINTWYTLKFEDTPGSLSFDDLMDQSWPRIIVVLLYCLVDFSLYMGLIHHLRTSKVSYLSLQ
jgi:hypothetical protein